MCQPEEPREIPPYARTKLQEREKESRLVLGDQNPLVTRWRRRHYTSVRKGLLGLWRLNSTPSEDPHGRGFTGLVFLKKKKKLSPA